MTEPLLPSTLPKRVVTNFVLPPPANVPLSMLRPSDCTYISARRFEQPITLVGFTALSVEIITIISTPLLTHKSATLRVPMTFTKIASHGFSSISGTCLYAAAWNTICGANFEKRYSKRWRWRTSPTIGTISRCGNFSSNSKRMLCIGVSALSNIMSWRMPNDANWRHNSEPIEPAAPVTRIDVLLNFSIISFIEIFISSRPSKSSILISRIEFCGIFPSTISPIGGTTNTLILFDVQNAMSWSRSSLSES